MSAGLTLLFDADDTLWLNATLFETALNDWQGLLSANGASGDEALALFKELEERGFRRGWYGSRRLEINMNAAARMLLDRETADRLASPIAEIVRHVKKPEVLVFDGVHETLQYLGRHHRLLLVTMGETSEQLTKIEGSGLGHYFSSIHILPDKTRKQYTRIIREHRLHRRDTWMIGNSLSKDIRPARAAGLKTCHIDNGHAFNFGLTVDSIEADIVIDEFHRLGEMFSVEE